MHLVSTFMSLVHQLTHEVCLSIERDNSTLNVMAYVWVMGPMWDTWINLWGPMHVMHEAIKDWPAELSWQRESLGSNSLSKNMKVTGKIIWYGIISWWQRAEGVSGPCGFCDSTDAFVNLLNIPFIHYSYLLVIERGSLNPIKLAISVPSSLFLTHWMDIIWESWQCYDFYFTFISGK